MNDKLASAVIRVIREERDRIADRLSAGDPDYAYDQWLFTEEPFLNELCLMLLVAIWHHVERELVWLTAQVTSDGRELEGPEYRQRVKKEREFLRSNGKPRMIAKLQLDRSAEWDSSMETLRLLANSYKHDPTASPDEALLKHLGLDRGVNYAPLAESPDLKKGLAASLGLQDGADYTDIAEELMARCRSFMTEVQENSDLVLSPIKPELVSSITFLH